MCTGQNPDVADLRHDLITDKVALNSGEEEALAYVEEDTYIW